LNNFVYISKSKVDKWRYNNLNKYADYFVEQWLTPPFDNWQLFRRPAGYAPTNGCEPINKRVKQDYLPDGKRLHIIDAFIMLEKLILKYSTDNFYPIMITSDMKKKVVENQIILDSTYVAPAEPRKLVARVNKRNRPAKITGKALKIIANIQ
jgi:hypothetical protein